MLEGSDELIQNAGDTFLIHVNSSPAFADRPSANWTISEARSTRIAGNG
jgi:hypothetical protein